MAGLLIRRGLYTFAKRTAPYAMTALFDGPSGEACLAKRDRSNTPMQALTMLNGDVLMECARALGQWAGENASPEETILEEMFQRCLTRPPSPEESSKAREFVAGQLARFKSGELNAGEFLGRKSDGDMAKEAAWTALARVLLNLDEAITKG